MSFTVSCHARSSASRWPYVREHREVAFRDVLVQACRQRPPMIVLVGRHSDHPCSTSVSFVSFSACIAALHPPLKLAFSPFFSIDFLCVPKEEPLKSKILHHLLLLFFLFCWLSPLLVSHVFATVLQNSEFVVLCFLVDELSFSCQLHAVACPNQCVLGTERLSPNLSHALHLLLENPHNWCVQSLPQRRHPGAKKCVLLFPRGATTSSSSQCVPSLIPAIRWVFFGPGTFGRRILSLSCTIISTCSCRACCFHFVRSFTNASCHFIA